MSGSYPPPENDAPRHPPPPYGRAADQGWQPPGGTQPGYSPPGRPPGPPLPPGPPPGSHAQPGPYASPGSPAPHARPEFMPPEYPPAPAAQSWGQELYYGDPPYGYPGWGEPPDPGIQTNAIFALAVSLITLTCCSNLFAVGGVVTSIIALTRWQQQPESARNLNRWAWISTGGGMVLLLLAVGGYAALQVGLALSAFEGT